MDTPPLYQFEAFPETSLFEGAWCLSLPPGEQVQEIAPDGCCELIVHRGRPPLELRADGEAEQPGALIYGPLTRVLELRPQGALDMMGLRFRSWAIGAFCPDPFALRNRAQPLEMVIGREVAGLLFRSAEAGFQAFGKAARDGLAPAATPPREQALLEQLAKELVVHPGAEIADLVHWSGKTQRTLGRYYRRCAGLTPGEYLRLRRFQRARTAIKQGATDLAGVAVDAGYADQAHMTRDFRRLAGRTPVQLRQAAGFDPLYEG